MRRFFLAFVLLCSAVGYAHAKWPTTFWTVLDHREAGGTQPEGGRERFAEKHKDILEHASFWFQSMSFAAPYQINDRKSLNFRRNERYLAYLDSNPSNFGSSHTSLGHMILSTHPGFLNPLTRNDRLFQAASVHELFHGIQLAYPAYRAYASTPQLPGPPDCDAGERANAWLTEGTASAVQIQYLERLQGRNFSHAFHGSREIRWVRAFDQSLDWGHLTPEQHALPPGSTYAWQCSYGTWYFWYAVGNMLGSKDPRDPRRTAYLRYLFAQDGAWAGTGLAQVDAALKRAGRGMNALPPYRDGLFALYPQFVAQYLDVDDFFNHVEYVDLGSPVVYEASSQGLKDPIEPVATRAWRVKVRLPRDAGPAAYTVRFVLDSLDPGARDALHLIVDDRVIERPANSDSPYSHTRRVESSGAADDGDIEFFVRVANVARDAASTTSAQFTLKVEVEGFYGELPAQGSYLGAVPPGFQISGPDANWSCAGNDDTRATFTFMTPDGVADQLQRMLPQGLKNIESDLDRAEQRAHQRNDAELQRVQRARERFEDGFDALMRGSNLHATVDRAASEMRLEHDSQIIVKLNGNNAAGPCHVLIVLTVPGAPAAQRIASDDFSLTITTDAMSRRMSAATEFSTTLDVTTLLSMSEEQARQLSQRFEQAMQGLDVPDHEWRRCHSGHTDCDDGEFALGQASLQHLFGSFRFQVYRDEPSTPTDYADVTGLINITSSKDQNDNDLLDFLSRGGEPGDVFRIPELERLLQGGSMFGQ